MEESATGNGTQGGATASQVDPRPAPTPPVQRYADREVPEAIAHGNGYVVMIGVCPHCGASSLGRPAYEQIGCEQRIVSLPRGERVRHHCLDCGLWFARWPRLGDRVRAAETAEPPDLLALGWRAPTDLRPKWRAAAAAREAR